MKIELKQLGAFMMFLISFASFSQGKLTGTIADDLGEPLPYVKVMEVGTSNIVVTNTEGKFELTTSVNSGDIEVSFIGFGTKVIPFDLAKSSNLGKIEIAPDRELSEVTVFGINDIAKDRITPIAVSTIQAIEISEKLGSQEFPEILKSTPSVYATKQGGGFGDARINIRGFDQRNTAIMINGVPVNDMENGWVYWSNWAGLSDVTSAMQVQRGLGSSKLAISSVGGTVNILTKAAERKQGGFVSGTYGNDNYLKTLASYSSGLMENGFAVTVLMGRTAGDGYVDGTKFEGYNYFAAIGYKPNKKHSFQLTATGAPQWHHQRDYAPSLYDYFNYSADSLVPNHKYNSDWGYRNGEEFSFRRNFYHKPVVSFNWDWELNEKSALSAVVYGSWGRGGGTGPRGGIGYTRPDGSTGSTSVYSSRLKDENGLMRWDDIAAYNEGGVFTALNGDVVGGVGNWAAADNGSSNTTFDGQNVTTKRNGYLLRGSMNSHNWYGTIVNFDQKLTDKLTLDVGVDARTYTGIHYRTLVDLLGADAYYSTGNSTLEEGQYYTSANTIKASPFENLNANNHSKINYYNDGIVNWLGAFGQLEYVSDKLSAFVQGAVSNQEFQRIDYFYPETDDAGNFVNESEKKSLLGGNVKGGFNYMFNAHHNVFINSGYYSKQPNFDAVFPGNQQTINENLTNEQIIGLELGYGLRTKRLSGNLNFYRTSWGDRYLTVNSDDVAGNDATANLSGVEQVHTGVELDFTYRPISKLTFDAMASYGNWVYSGDVNMQFVNEDNELVDVDIDGDGELDNTLYLDGVKVGDAAQFTARVGATYQIIPGLKVDGSWYFADNLYADIDPTSFFRQGHDGSLKLPSYNLFNLGASYVLPLGKEKKQSLKFRVNANNILNTIYIAESETNNHVQTSSDFDTTEEYNDYLANGTYNGIDRSNRVFFGFGRTWNFSIRYTF